MIIGGYSRWLMVDIGDLGWIADKQKATLRRRYLSILWGRIDRDTGPKVCCTSMAIAPVFTGSNGKAHNEQSQFQKVFSLLNGGNFIPHPIDHRKFLSTIQKILSESNLNFYLRFDMKQHLLIKEISFCKDSVIKYHEEFQWPDSTRKRLVQDSAPDINASTDILSGMDFSPKSNKVKLDTPIDLSGSDFDLTEFNDEVA